MSTTPSEATRSSSGLRQTLRALRHRNYRLFFAGQGISLVGTWMQRIALNWLVYELTHSATMLGLVGFAGQIPTFLLAPLAGVLSDRWNLHRVIVITQVLATIQALILAALDLTGTTQVWHVLVLSIFLGVVNAFDMPARQTFVVQMLESPADLPNAIALNSFLVNSARLLGPSIAGVLIAAVGEGVCFLLNGLTYVPVVAALLAMKLRPRQQTPDHKHVLHGLKEGFVYAFGFPPIRAILLLLALVSLVGMPYAVLMPVFADKILHGGPRTLGFLMAATGLGAIAGALVLARRSSVVGLGRLIAWSAGLFGAGLIAVSLSRLLWLSLLLLAITGFAMMQQMAASNTVLQTIVADEKRGRVMSFYTMSFMGMVPFGSLLAGGLAGWVGAPNTLLIGGCACVVGAAGFALALPGLRVLVRPIYVDKGIIPGVASLPVSGTPPMEPPA
jgi:MFS family permease